MSIALDSIAGWDKGVIVLHTNQFLTSFLTPVQKRLAYGSCAAQKMPHGNRAVGTLSLKKGRLAHFIKVSGRKPFR
jgi:hypothetical protein